MSFAKKRSNGYYGVAVYRDKNGKRHQKGAGTFRLKREALAAADKLEQKLGAIDVELSMMSFADYYQRWYDLYKKNGISDISRSRYEIFGREIANYFGNKKTIDIRRSDYQGFINQYGANHAYKSVSKLNGAVKACVRSAIDDDIIIKDFTHVQLVYNKNREVNVEYLNNDEIVRLKNETLKKLSVHNTSRYMILTAIFTGLRKSEIQALTWNDIDYLHHTICVTKSWDDAKKAFKGTKTISSRRTIKVNAELLKLLAPLKANGSTMAFRNQFGTIPTSTALNKCLRSIMADCGIKKQGFHFHSLRHVHVAYLLNHGVDVYAISKRLGHSDITVTLKTYSYLIDEVKAKNDSLIIDKLSKLI